MKSKFLNYDHIVLISAVLLFAVASVRAATAAITYDEAYTYIFYSRSPIFLFKFDLANNHFLNSVLIYLFSSLTRTEFNELIIRLPNLITYIVYLFAAIRISRTFRYPFWVLCLLLCNYYVSEYFGQARGYGLATAFVLLALTVYRQNRKSIVLSTYFLLLASTASFHVIVLLACFMIYAVAEDISFAKLSAFIKQNFIHLVIQVAIGTIVVAIFLSVTEAGRPLFGSRDSFFEAILNGFSGMFTKDAIHKSILSIASIGLLVAGVLRAKRSILKFPHVTLTLAYFLTVLLLATLSGRPLPTGRILVPLWPVVALAIAELTEIICSQKYTRVIVGLLSFLLIINFVGSIQLKTTVADDPDMYTRSQIYSAAINNKPLIHTKFDPIEMFYSERIKAEFGRDLLAKQ